MTTSLVRRKQTTTQAEWLSAVDAVEERVPRTQLDGLIDRTLCEIRDVLARHRRVAFAWSGGKDSMALEWLMRQVGIGECLLAICNLEYPRFLQWATDHMPPLLEVVNTGQDLDWLASHPDMLFPQDAATAGKWFRIVQHRAQRDYYRRRRLDLIVLGRRHADGNFTGPNGLYTNRERVTRYSPIRDWSHEDILALMHYERLAYAPFYSWPQGFRCGTHAWAARQWTGSVAQGWHDVYRIDPGIVREAARRIPSAAAYLETR